MARVTRQKPPGKPARRSRLLSAGSITFADCGFDTLACARCVSEAKHAETVMAERNVGSNVPSVAEGNGQPYVDCARCSTSAVRSPWLDWRADRRNGSEGAPPIESRRKQEQIAERWHPKTATRSERYRELFCVPILLTFREEIAESQLDFVLGVASKHIGLQAQMDAELRNNGLSPFIVLDDLFPMSGIRRVALEQVQNAVQVRSALDLRAVTSSWSRNPETPMRQSAAFLFYVVGLHAGPRSQHSYDRDGATCDGLAASISRFVRDAIGWVEVIQARLFRGFFDGLFEGIWMYQDARLTQVAARAKQSAAIAEVSARIEVEAGRDTHPGSSCSCTRTGREPRSTNVSA